MHVKEQTCTLLILTCYSSRNCTKLVLKPLAAKKDLSISVLCSAPADYTIQFIWWILSIHVHYAIFLQSSATIFDWNKKQCSESNILTMDHELVNPSQAAVYTLLNTIIYLKVVKYLNIRLRQIYQTKLQPKGC